MKLDGFIDYLNFKKNRESDHEEAQLVYLNIVSLLCIQTIGKAVGDWFYDRKVVQLIDCTYPCNPTCKDLVEDSLQG